MKSQRNKILKGSIVLIAAKWIQRLFGIVSLLVLARILGPEDFGVVAMSYVLLGAFEALTVTGAQQYLLSRTSVVKEEIDTAWTINLFAKSAVSLLLFLIAPFAANLFHEPRLELVLYWTSCIPIINALASPGVFLKQRDFQYGAISICQIITKAISFAITIFIAVRFQSYWALVVGSIASAALYSSLTYTIHPHRPYFCLSGIKTQWVFSKWMLARSVVGFTRAKADQFIVGVFYDTDIVGRYNVSKELAMMPFNQIAQPLSPLFLSMFTKDRDSAAGLRESYTLKFIVMFALMIPISCGFFILREELSHLLLGGKWTGAHILIGNLIPLILTYSMTASSSAVLVVLDRLKYLFFLEIITMSVIVIGQLAARELPIEEFALVRSLLGVVTFGIYFSAVSKAIQLDKSRLLIGIFPALIGGIILYAGLLLLQIFFSDAILVLVSVPVGAMLYMTVTYSTLYALRKSSVDLTLIYETCQEYAANLNRRLKNAS